MIKARVCAGDRTQGEAFLAALRPFVWRRSLDYDTIADIGAIKRQIHVHKVDERLTAPGHNLKLGAGGIREIEFFVQTQQLILGGRDPALRSPRTLDALAALAAAGHTAPEAARELAEAYVRLRGWEHRLQMVADEQTHTLPELAPARGAVGALAGFATLARFDPGGGGDTGCGQRPLCRAVRPGRGPVHRLWQPGVHRRGGRPGDPDDAGADGVLPAGSGLGHRAGLAPRPHRRHPHRARPPAPDPAGAAPAGGGPRHRPARRRLQPLRRLLRGTERGRAGAGPAAGQAGAVRAGGAGDGLCAGAGPGAGAPARRAGRPAGRALLRPAGPRGGGGSDDRRGGPRAELRGGHGRRAPRPRRPGLPHRRAGDVRRGGRLAGGAQLRRPGRRLPGRPGRRRPGGDRAAGRRLPRRGGGGGARPRRLARDDRPLRPGPDDRLPRRPPGRLGRAGLERGDLLRPLLAAADHRPVGPHRGGGAVRSRPAAETLRGGGAGRGQPGRLVPLLRRAGGRPGRRWP